MADPLEPASEPTPDATAPDVTDMTEAVEDATPEPLPPPPTPEEADRAESLLRQARLARIRGENSVADRLLDEAVKTAPGSATVLEAVGDSLAERRQWRRAQQAYAQAHRVEPSNASIERKFGEMVLRVAGVSDPMAMLSQGTDNGFVSAKAAAIMSFIIPGLGQIVRGQVGKGIGMLAAVLIGWIGAIMTPNGLRELPAVMVGRSSDLNGFVFLPLFIAVAAHLWAIVDAASGAKASPRRVVNKPVPPVDKDFEL